jgi:hypothetical protein
MPEYPLHTGAMSRVCALSVRRAACCKQARTEASVGPRRSRDTAQNIPCTNGAWAQGDQGTQPRISCEPMGRGPREIKGHSPEHPVHKWCNLSTGGLLVAGCATLARSRRHARPTCWLTRQCPETWKSFQVIDEVFTGCYSAASTHTRLSL